MSKFRGVSSGRGEESIERSTDADFLLLYGKLPVLVLCHDAKGWRMFYTKEFKAQKKVRPLVQFPAVDKEYRSSELWPFFAVRIPSISRPEVLRTVQAEKLDYDDVAAMLSRFGRKSVASPFELKPKEEADLLLAGTSDRDTQLCDEVEKEVGNERRD